MTDAHSLKKAVLGKSLSPEAKARMADSIRRQLRGGEPIVRIDFRQGAPAAAKPRKAARLAAVIAAALAVCLGATAFAANCFGLWDKVFGESAPEYSQHINPGNVSVSLADSEIAMDSLVYTDYGVYAILKVTGALPGDLEVEAHAKWNNAWGY